MDLIQDLSLSHGILAYQNYPAHLHTAYGIGGNSDYFIKVSSVKGLKDSVEYCLDHGIDYKIIGNGTNVLLADDGYRGAIIYTVGLNGIKHQNGKIIASCGALLHQVICFALSYDLYGGEQLIGIPATVGGAVCMNAGAYGKTLSDVVESVTVLNDGKLLAIDKDQCGFGYRTSRFYQQNLPIVNATFCFEKTGRYDSQYQQRIDICNKLRKQSQPQERSCGSVFKNPTNDYAGRIIQDCGLKGYGIGSVKISDKHANFITVEKSATSKEVYALMQYIKNRVYQLTGITLEREVELLGEFE